jgi:hypothetical protein
MGMGKVKGGAISSMIQHRDDQRRQLTGVLYVSKPDMMGNVFLVVDVV